MSQHHPLSTLRKNVKYSLATYTSAMDPSGLDMFLIKIFSVHNIKEGS
jgi:hypothetical protein